MQRRRRPTTRTDSHEGRRFPDQDGGDRATRGQAVAGPAFYVWEEDTREAREWGAELADAWLASSQHSVPRSGS